jgi:hypothetical protein
MLAGGAPRDRIGTGYLIGNYPVYISFSSLWNEDLYSVLPPDRVLAGQEIRDTVFHGIRLPPMGSLRSLFLGHRDLSVIGEGGSAGSLCEDLRGT